MEGVDVVHTMGESVDSEAVSLVAVCLVAASVDSEAVCPEVEGSAVAGDGVVMCRPPIGV